MLDLFSDTPPWQEPLAPGAVVLRRFSRERAPALLQAADRVVFVRDGRITAEGEHTDLMGHEQYREVVRR